MSESKKKFSFTMPDTYVIIFGIIVVAWLSTFIVPVGQYTAQQVVFQGTLPETTQSPSSDALNIDAIAAGIMPVLNIATIEEARVRIQKVQALENSFVIKNISPSDAGTIRSLVKDNNGKEVKISADADTFSNRFSKSIEFSYKTDQSTDIEIFKNRVAAGLNDILELNSVERAVDKILFNTSVENSDEKYFFLVNGLNNSQLIKFEDFLKSNDNVEITSVSDYYADDTNGKKILKPLALFHYDINEYSSSGFLKFPFDGLKDMVSIVIFIIIIGGAFGIIIKTGAIETGILAVIKKIQGLKILVIPILFFVFSMGGAVFGMGEEAIAFAMIVVPLVIALGYDGIVGVMITYGATQVGFATSWQNPFSLLVAQGVAGIPIMSGWQMRVGMYVFFLLFSIFWVTLYALKIQKDPLKSLSYASDAYFREDLKHSENIHVKFGLSHALVLLSLVGGIVWIVLGVTGYGAGNGYYIAEIATVFFTIGLVAGIIGVIFKMNGMKVNDIASSFKDGVRDIISAAIIVGLAKGVILVLGGDKSYDMTVFNTMINGVSSVLQIFPRVMGAWLMYLFTAVFNFFITSGSAKAGLIIPVLSEIADTIQIPRQVACLSFQLGDGFTNMIVPTSGALMGSLAAARMEWTTWAKFQWKLQLIYFALGSIIVIGAVIFNFS